MEQRRKEQDYKDKKEKRRLLRVFKSKFKIKDETSTEKFAKRIIDEFYGKVDFGWEYYRMISWAEENKKKASLSRFSNWVKKRAEWDEDKKESNNNGKDIYREQTKRVLEQFGRHKQSADPD